MSCFDVQILDPNINTIEIETCIGNQPSSIDIVSYDNSSIIEINHCIALLPSEINDLITVKDILAGSGIGVSSSSGNFTISVTGTFGLTSEEVDDRVNQLLNAGSYINLNYNDLSNTLTVSVTGLQPSGDYSIVGHSHIANDIVDFNSTVSGLIPPPNFTSLTGISGITVNNIGTDYVVSLSDPTIQLGDITDLSSDAKSFLLNPSSNNLKTLITNETGSGLVVFNDSPNFSGIPTAPTAPSGTNSDQIASTSFVRNEIANLVDSAPTTLDTLNELAAALGDDPNFATTITNSLSNKANLSGAIFTGSVTIPSGTGNFNNLTVNNSGVSLVGHTHISSNITDFNSTVSGLLPVKDIIPGTGIGVTSSNGVFTINSSNSFSTDTLEPDGFVNRTDSIISFNDSSREFNISPKSPATNYSIYNNGVKVVKNAAETITLPDTTALYFIHFDKSTNNLSYKTTSFNFDTDIPVAQIYYNADDNKAVYFGEERHGIRMDASTHRYLHNVFGTQYVNGLSIGNYSTSGDGSANSDATVAIGDGLIYDEDIDVNITNSAMPSDPFEQVLYPVAQIPVYYKVGSIGAWTDTTANNFPLKVDITAQYNLNSAGVWSAANSNAPNNNRYVASWLCATSQEHSPIIAIMGQRLDSSLEQATSNNSWSDLNLNGLPITELRPLYRLIYDTKSSFVNGAKAFLVDVLDIRSHIDTITGLPQNDHGNLYGLADDDHYQYIHIDNSRTINAIHTFNNGLNASGLINAVSGNFSNNLYVNGVQVSVSGHTHTSSYITDFNSSVSGLLPVKNITTTNNITVSSSSGTYTIGSSGLIKSDTTDIAGASVVTNIVQISQANFANIVSPDPNTLYIIND